MLEAWLPLRKLRHNFVKAVRGNSAAQIFNGSSNFPLADSTSVAVESTITYKISKIWFFHTISPLARTGIASLLVRAEAVKDYVQIKEVHAVRMLCQVAGVKTSMANISDLSQQHACKTFNMRNSHTSLRPLNLSYHESASRCSIVISIS